AGNWSANGPTVTITTQRYVAPADPQPEPELPVEPEQPVEPQQPEQPEQPADPEVPGEPKQPVEFSDVPATHWAAAAIKRATALGIVQGYPDGSFKPTNAITRAQFMTMLANAFKWQETTSELIFTDSEEIGEWA